MAPTRPKRPQRPADPKRPDRSPENEDSRRRNRCGTMEEHPERYSAVNATAHLTPVSPPALVIYGPNDWLVPAQGPIGYVLRCRQLGVDVKSVSIPWTGHLMGLNGAAGRAGEQLTAEWFAAH